MVGLLTAIWKTVCDVVLFWWAVSFILNSQPALLSTNFFQQFSSWLTRKSPVELWLEILRDAKTFEEFEEAAFQLDVLSGNDLWYGTLERLIRGRQ